MERGKWRKGQSNKPGVKERRKGRGKVDGYWEGRGKRKESGGKNKEEEAWELWKKGRKTEKNEGVGKKGEREGERKRRENVEDEERIDGKRKRRGDMEGGRG